MRLTPIYIVPGNHGTDLTDVNTMQHIYYKADEVRACLADVRKVLQDITETSYGDADKVICLTHLDWVRKEAQMCLTRLQEVAP